jgi:mRNA interferase RelE/StbE
MYKVIIHKQILKSLDNIPVIYLPNIKKSINDLAENPRPLGSIKLSGSKNHYRIRVGVYRVIYSVKDDMLIVEVIKIDHRRNIYR